MRAIGAFVAGWAVGVLNGYAARAHEPRRRPSLPSVTVTCDCEEADPDPSVHLRTCVYRLWHAVTSGRTSSI